jgi:hypothetical protein
MVDNHRLILREWQLIVLNAYSEELKLTPNFSKKQYL